MFKETVFRIDGLEDLRRNLQKADAKLYAGSKRTNEAAAKRIVATARHLVPVDTGRLYNAIAYTMNRSVAYVGVRKTRAEGARAEPYVYWRFVEFGTWFRPATPFFRPAAEGEKARYVNDFKRIGVEMERF